MLQRGTIVTTTRDGARQPARLHAARREGAPQETRAPTETTTQES